MSIPHAPLRWWHDEESALQTLEAPDLARQLCDRGDGGCILLVEAMLRPVVLLQDRPQGVLGDALALSIVPLVGLSSIQRESVRDQREPSLFHLPARPTKYGLEQEMAVDLNGLLRVGSETLLPRTVGRLDDNEMRVIGERLVAHLDIDLEPIVAQQVDAHLQQLPGPAML